MWWRENGELLQKGAFVDGEQDGLWTRWHETGAKLDEGQWVRGKKSGIWKRYDRDGVLVETTSYAERS